MEEIDFKELAKQLSCPEGEFGIEIGQRMHENNREMVSNSIESLQLKPSEKILELGFGSALHLNSILEKAIDLQYFGIEISALMLNEAQKIHQNFMFQEKANFQLYDGENIPFEDHFFDKIMTVNTLYFWKKPEKILDELFRVLKPNGHCSICFGDKNFMENLPFTKHGFNLYHNDWLIEKAKLSGFEKIEIKNCKDSMKNMEGENFERPFYILVLSK